MMLQSLTFALSSPSFQLQWTPQPEWTEFTQEEELYHPLSKIPPKCTPWLVFNNEDWQFRSTVVPHLRFQQTMTSVSTTKNTIGQIHSAVVLERKIPTNTHTWLTGIGVWYNAPIVNQSSDVFSEEEQESVDAQNSVVQAEIRSLDINIPLSIAIPVNPNIIMGIGITYHWVIQYTSNEVERQWTHQTFPTPSMYIQL